jgi:hypothetical protein
MWKSSGKTVRHFLLLPNRKQFTESKRREGLKGIPSCTTALEDSVALLSKGLHKVIMILSSSPFGSYAMRYALCVSKEKSMPAIASLEDLKSAQKDLQEAKDLNELKTAFKKWRRIGWKNVCKLWLQERTPEELKGESG